MHPPSLLFPRFYYDLFRYFSDSESQEASQTIPEPISDSPTYSRVVLFEHLDDLCVICCDTFSDDVTNLTLRWVHSRISSSTADRDSETWNMSKVYFSPCNHTYHKDCILRWKLENNSCPMCRTQMETESDPAKSPSST